MCVYFLAPSVFTVVKKILCRGLFVESLVKKFKIERNRFYFL